jgi:GntR family transcriptional regulator
MYQQDFGINVIGTAEKVRACTANAEDARWLKLPQGAALLEIRRVAFSYNEQPVEWRVSRVNTERYEYVGQEHQSS